MQRLLPCWQEESAERATNCVTLNLVVHAPVVLHAPKSCLYLPPSAYCTTCSTTTSDAGISAVTTPGQNLPLLLPTAGGQYTFTSDPTPTAAALSAAVDLLTGLSFGRDCIGSTRPTCCGLSEANYTTTPPKCVPNCRAIVLKCCARNLSCFSLAAKPLTGAI